MNLLKLSLTALLWLLFGCSSSEMTGSGSARSKTEAAHKGGKDGPLGDDKGQGKDADDAGDGEDSGGVDTSDGEGTGKDGVDTETANAEPDTKYDSATAEDPDVEVGEDGNAVVRFRSKGEGSADVAFFVDTSASMTQEIGLLQSELGDFVKKFADDKAKLDINVFVIAGTSKNTLTLPSSVTSLKNVESVNQPVKSKDGLARARDFLAGSISPSKMELRDTAVKELVFVTDDDGRDMGAGGFSAFLAGRDDEVHVNGIVGLSKGENGPGCKIANVGQAYQSLAAMSEHQGLIQDLCARDWDKLMTSLSDSIRSHAKFKFELSVKPKEGATLTVYVNGKELESDDFSFDESTQTVTIDKDKAPKDGQKVKITYASE